MISEYKLAIKKNIKLNEFVGDNGSSNNSIDFKIELLTKNLIKSAREAESILLKKANANKFKKENHTEEE